MEGSIEGDFYFKTVAYAATPEAQSAQRERQQAIDRAVQEAVGAANEKAAKERAELQATMQRMIEQAMAKQAAMLEAERKLREESQRKSEASASPAQHTPAPPPAVAIAAPVSTTTPAASSRPTPSPQPPVSLGQQPTSAPVIAAATSSPSKPVQAAITVAALSPSKAPEALQTNSSAKGRTPQPGDEWEYDVNEEIFGAKAKLIWRVKAATNAGTLEELLVNDQSVIEWVFGNEADAIGAPISTGLVFGHNWSGNLPTELNVHGLSGCVKRLCALREIQIKGKESLAVPAGKFETTRVDAYVFAQAAVGIQMVRIGRISFWYDEPSRRLIKQLAQMNGRFGGVGSKETVELQAIRQR